MFLFHYLKWAPRFELGSTSLSENPGDSVKTLVFPRILIILSLSTAFASLLEQLQFFSGKRGIREQSGSGNPVDYRIIFIYSKIPLVGL
jgi:hypothetical protein